MSLRKLALVTTRARVVRFDTVHDMRACAEALVCLSSVLPAEAAVLYFVGPLQRCARTEPRLLCDVYDAWLQSCASDDAHAPRGHPVAGGTLALMARTLPSHADHARVWQHAERRIVDGLRAGWWRVSEVKHLVMSLGERARGTSDVVACAVVDALVAFVLQQLRALADQVATAQDASTDTVTSAGATAPVLFSLAALLVSELHVREDALMHAVATCSAAVMDGLAPGTVGYVCYLLNRTTCVHTALAVALQEAADRVAEQGDVFTALHVLAFLARHAERYVSVDALQWLLERIMGNELDADSVMLLLAALEHAVAWREASLRATVRELLGYAAEQARQVLQLCVDGSGGDMGTGACAARTLETMLTRIQALCNEVASAESATATTPARAANTDTAAAVAHDAGAGTSCLASLCETHDACAEALGAWREEVVSAEDGGAHAVALMTMLLSSPVASARACATARALLQECERQHVSFATADAVRVCLLFADADDCDADTVRCMRAQLLRSASSLSMLQLTACLRALARCAHLAARHRHGSGSGLGVDDDADDVHDDDIVSNGSNGSNDDAVVHPPARRQRQQRQQQSDVAWAMEQLDQAEFARACADGVRAALAEGMTMACGLALVAALHDTGCRDDELYASVASYLDAKAAVALTEANAHCRHNAARVRAVVGATAALASSPTLQRFLDTVLASSTCNEASLTPRQWLQLHDPAYHVTAPSKEQQAAMHALDALAATPCEEHDALAAHMDAYVQHMHALRPDEHKHVFALCAEKVIKADKQLKTCLAHLLDSGAVAALSGDTIATVLHSLASVRFVYTGTVKQLLRQIRAEQWGDMDAAPLVRIASALATWSIREPTILAHLCQRLLTLHVFLSPHDTATALRALLALGCGDEEVVRQLMARAAAAAARFDAASLTLLFSAPSLHRQLGKAAVALPLLQRANAVLTSPVQREHIARCVRRSSLPRDLVQQTARNLLDNAPTRANAQLRLT